MSKQRELVLDAGQGPVEDELRLPHEPGVIRRFWARHPLFADVLLALSSLLIALPAVAVRPPTGSPLSMGETVFVVTASLVSAVALLRRRRWPVAVFAIAVSPSLIVGPGLAAALSGPAALIALYSVAVYRNAHACWRGLGVTYAVLSVNCLVRTLLHPSELQLNLNVAISTAVALLIGALVGVNVGNRRRYLDALIDRSRQLVIERDQQAQLAAAAERAHIAREMHDIVSHSLTVVVALADGASVTGDRDQAREATRAISATARDALSEMRSMLGVLRSAASDTDTLVPVWEGSPHEVVSAAQRGGIPVTLSITGSPEATPAQQLAVRRIVQEAITNAVRYSTDLTYIRAETTYDDAEIRILVENDGARSGAPSIGAGWGLVGLRERVLSLHGSFAAGIVAPRLWRITATLPKELPRD